MTNPTLTSEKRTNRHRLVFGICLVGYLFGGLVSTLMSVYLPDVVSDLMGNVPEAERATVGAYIGATFLYGWMLGGLAFGFAGDRFGRVRSFAMAVGLYGLCTILTGYAPTWTLLSVYRCLSGMGVGGVLVLATVWVAEAWPDKTRNVAVGILAVSFPVGIIGAGALQNLIGSWREAFLIGWIPLTLAVVTGIVLRESVGPKEKVAPGATHSPQPSVLLFGSAQTRSLWLGSLLFGAVLVGLWAVFSWLPTWVQSLFAQPAVATPGFQPGAGQTERGLVMILLGSGGILGGCFSGLLVNRLGYRNTLLMTFAGSFLMCFLLFTTNFTFSSLIYLETGLLALFFGVSQGALSAFIPALFPKPIRSTATGFCFNIGRLFTATAVFFVGALVSVLGGYGNAVLMFSTTFLIGLAVLLLSPTLGETKSDAA